MLELDYFCELFKFDRNIKYEIILWVEPLGSLLLSAFWFTLCFSQWSYCLLNFSKLIALSSTVDRSFILLVNLNSASWWLHYWIKF
ncbi:hypothetical protein CONCODRAFT_76856 [Conidiobolus coronatus NRRL 28638]|uniref:Uncharacterized protein n=1 Tax=Conidiobolus coronatus (strain ATCC 28846 / CBS 209.66 / NRRL 28638) TaxID=796925 RepID=A0A137PHL3_CONC2|nr:hypothetical protein CONCODRAFT_76856 [Conidiobolus coronatus NRRL 28638]|eukprot:KXN74470.1 hypothetical protein CONCODRAFT_76856 [Conidiobolus coronatus NRRL 28638]